MEYSHTNTGAETSGESCSCSHLSAAIQHAQIRQGRACALSAAPSACHYKALSTSHSHEDATTSVPPSMCAPWAGCTSSRCPEAACALAGMRCPPVWTQGGQPECA